jgi:hypothetical protein
MLVFPQEKPRAKNKRAVGPDQYRATMMMTTTRNAAISHSARSKFFDLHVSALSQSEA